MRSNHFGSKVVCEVPAELFSTKMMPPERLERDWLFIPQVTNVTLSKILQLSFKVAISTHMNLACMPIHTKCRHKLDSSFFNVELYIFLTRPWLPTALFLRAFPMAFLWGKGMRGECHSYTLNHSNFTLWMELCKKLFEGILPYINYIFPIVWKAHFVCLYSIPLLRGRKVALRDTALSICSHSLLGEFNSFLFTAELFVLDLTSRSYWNTPTVLPLVLAELSNMT